jgi:hypothetical protein
VEVQQKRDGEEADEQVLGKVVIDLQTIAIETAI